MVRTLIVALVSNIIVACLMLYVTGQGERNLVAIRFEEVSLSNSTFDQIATSMRPLESADEDNPYSSLFDNGFDLERYNLRNRTDRQINITLNPKPDSLVVLSEGSIIADTTSYQFDLRPNEERDIIVATKSDGYISAFDDRPSMQISANNRLVQVQDFAGDEFSLRNEIFRVIGPNDFFWILIFAFTMIGFIGMGWAVIWLMLSPIERAKLTPDEEYARSFEYAKLIRKEIPERWRAIRKKIVGSDD